MSPSPILEKPNDGLITGLEKFAGHPKVPGLVGKAALQVAGVHQRALARHEKVVAWADRVDVRNAAVSEQSQAQLADQDQRLRERFGAPTTDKRVEPSGVNEPPEPPQPV